MTVEPGGAVELSGPPMDGPVQAIAAMAADRAGAARGLRTTGSGAGAARRRSAAAGQARQPGARYQAMETFFTASQTGAAGAAMTATASIQINLDAGSAGRAEPIGCRPRARRP